MTEAYEDDKLELGRQWEAAAVLLLALRPPLLARMVVVFRKGGLERS